MTPGGIVYVLDGASNEVSSFSPDGRRLGHVGGFGWTGTSFDHPADLCAPNDLDLYVADYGNHRIQRLDRNLNFVSSFDGQQENQSERIFGYPRSVGLSSSGVLFITDGENRRIVELSGGNEVQRSFGGVGSGAGSLANPTRVRVGENDLVVVQDGNRLVVFDLYGNFVKTIGEGAFNHLRTFSIDGSQIYALDSCSIYSVDSDGMIAPVALSDSSIDLCEVRDVAVRKDSVYLLSSHRLIVEQLPPPETPGK